jgi:hypothetical protein
MKHQKAQSAIEFFILIGSMLFIFVTLLGLISGNIGQKEYQKRDIAAKELALSLQDEINLAQAASDGYSRQFKMPFTTLGYDYNVTLVDGYVYVQSLDGKHALALPGYNASGQPVVIGDNNITKRNGTIYLNKYNY